MTREYEVITTEQTDDAIKNNLALQEVELVCKQIPLPEDFALVWKGGLNDDQAIVLSYYYSSNTGYEDARSLWNDYFLRNNWAAEKEKDSYPQNIRFQNARFKVSITYGGMGKRTQYSISCEKLAAEN